MTMDTDLATGPLRSGVLRLDVVTPAGVAVRKGVGLVVAGHWGTEHAVADVLAAHIAKQFPQLTVAHAEADKDPYSYLL